VSINNLKVHEIRDPLCQSITEEYMK
jgi:hypothetical protein